MSKLSSFRIPVQSLLPLGIITGALVVGAAANKFLNTWMNDGIPPRFGLDEFEKQLMERDRRIVGDYIKQSDEVVAPASFHTNSVSYLIKY